MIFVASVYHPVDEFEHTDFIDNLISIMSYVPKTEDFIGGHDVNANLGIRTKMYRNNLGPWGTTNGPLCVRFRLTTLFEIGRDGIKR